MGTKTPLVAKLQLAVAIIQLVVNIIFMHHPGL